MQNQKIITLEERSFGFLGIFSQTRTITIREEPAPVQLLIGNTSTTPTKSIGYNGDILSNANTVTNIIKTLSDL